MSKVEFIEDADTLEIGSAMFRLEWKRGMIRLGFLKAEQKAPPHVAIWVYFGLDDLKALSDMINKQLPVIEKVQLSPNGK